MANGKKFSQRLSVCASNDWPLGTWLKITANDRSVAIRVTDRMAKRFNGKRVDLSRVVWDYLSKGKKPGLIRGAKVERL